MESIKPVYGAPTIHKPNQKYHEIETLEQREARTQAIFELSRENLLGYLEATPSLFYSTGRAGIYLDIRFGTTIDLIVTEPPFNRN